MRAQVNFPQQFEFAISNSNQILVENQAEGVIIRAARNTISSREKLFIIRHLAMEGFIPERYQWFTDSEPESFSGLSWTVDDSWLKKDSAQQRKALRQILRLIFWAGLFWLALMAFAFLHAPH